MSANNGHSQGFLREQEEFARYFSYVAGLVKKWQNDLHVHDIEDIAQVALLKFYQYREKHHVESVLGLLTCLARRESVDFLRRKIRNRTSPLVVDLAAPETESLGQLEVMKIRVSVD